MSNAKRKTIEEKFWIDREDLEGNAVDIINRLQGWIDQYGDTVRIEMNICYGGYSHYDDYFEIEGRYEREETDKEVERRLARAKKAQETRKKNREAKEAKERKELARLLEKYGEA